MQDKLHLIKRQILQDNRGALVAVDTAILTKVIQGLVQKQTPFEVQFASSVWAEICYVLVPPGSEPFDNLAAAVYGAQQGAQHKYHAVRITPDGNANILASGTEDLAAAALEEAEPGALLYLVGVDPQGEIEISPAQ